MQDERKTKVLHLKSIGNVEFCKGKYREAIAAYSAGMDFKYLDDELTCILFTNRAAAHFHLGNHNSSLNDCNAALSLKSNHFKALKRKTQCLFHKKQYSDCVYWGRKSLDQKYDIEVSNLVKLSFEFQKQMVNKSH